MQAPKLDIKLSDLTRAKFIQVIFVTNIQALLEIFISLYELRRSTLQEVFLRPSEQFEAFNENDEFVQKNYVSVDRDYNVEWNSVPRMAFGIIARNSHAKITIWRFLIYNFFKFQQSTVDKMYDRCAVSVYGGSKILICNGGVGTGKTAFIRHLLFRFAKENFMITNSILVCGRNNALVDAMATTMMNKIKSSSSNDIPNKEIIEQVSKYFGE